MPYDESIPNRVREFAELLPVTKGPLAGHRFRFFPWQWDNVIKPLFGELKDDGFRKYRFCYVEVPKKNGKTPLAAVLGLYGLFADREVSPEVYIAAAEREQAGYCYEYAEKMLMDSEIDKKDYKRVPSRKRLINYRNNGFLQVLSSEAYSKHGINPSVVIIDELHAHQNDDLYYTLTSGTHYARNQQIVFIMSTAGKWDVEHIWYKIRSKAIQVRDNIVKQDNFLPVLYLADPEKDDPHDEEVWKRVNPSLNHLFTMDMMREEHQEATSGDPEQWARFRQLRLNMPVSQVKRWMPMEFWDKCAGKFDIDDLKGHVCYGGLDLSTKLDLTAFVLVFLPFDDDDTYKVVCQFYVPEDTVAERSKTDRVHYEAWVDSGFITATPGNVIDYEFIQKDIVKASEDYDLQEIGFDPWNASALANTLYNDYGIMMVEMRQGTKTLSEPAKDILVNVKQEKLSHAGNPVLRWCADNLVMIADANENIRPAKDKAVERIDGMVALINAWGRLIFSEYFGDPTVRTVS
jgi:phage terminase large subunit-like protein